MGVKVAKENPPLRSSSRATVTYDVLHYFDVFFIPGDQVKSTLPFGGNVHHRPEPFGMGMKRPYLG